MGEEGYIRKLSEHDWSFEFSDDHRAYLAGRREREALLEAAKTIDPDFEIWNIIAPPDHQRIV